MSKTLYEDALAEAKQLREVAEKNAKQAIIEAMTPKIRQLIEKELISSDEIPETDDDNILMDIAVDVDQPPPSMEDPVGLGMPSDDDMLTLNLDDIALGGELEPVGAAPLPPQQLGIIPEVEPEVPAEDVDLDTAPADEDFASEEDEGSEVEVSAEALKLLAALINERKGSKTNQGSPANLNELSQRIVRLRKRLAVFSQINKILGEQKVNESSKIKTIWDYLLKEAKTLHQELIRIQRTGAVKNEVSRPQRTLNLIIEEMKDMSSRRRDTLYEIDLNELELVGEEDADDLDLDADAGGDLEDEDLEDLEGEDVETDEPNMEAAEDALFDLADALGLDLEGGEGEDEDLEDEDLEDDEGEGEDLEDLEAESHVFEDDVSEEDVIEIDEGMLRRELLRMRRMAESSDGTGYDTIGDPTDGAESYGGAKKASRQKPDNTDSVGDAKTGASSYGGGKAGQDAFTNPPKLNVHAEVRRLRTQMRQGARNNRALKGQLTEYKNAVTTLRQQLTEMNLFNAKLLYANKLLQNKEISPRSMRTMIESLDGAKSLREVKLIFKALTESLPKTKKTMSESRVRKTLGSSSRPTRSAGSSSDGRSKEVDRWALLAGINN